jgi:hypothetical protein
LFAVLKPSSSTASITAPGPRAEARAWIFRCGGRA